MHDEGVRLDALQRDIEDLTALVTNTVGSLRQQRDGFSTQHRDFNVRLTIIEPCCPTARRRLFVPSYRRCRFG